MDLPSIYHKHSPRLDRLDLQDPMKQQQQLHRLQGYLAHKKTPPKTLP